LGHDLPISASQVAGTTGLCHHIHLDFHIEFHKLFLGGAGGLGWPQTEILLVLPPEQRLSVLLISGDDTQCNVICEVETSQIHPRDMEMMSQKAHSCSTWGDTEQHPTCLTN
jgi:hypothetical protein